MKVEPDGRGGWRVVDDTGAVVAKGLTNREAWAHADRANSEALNRQEHVHDWSAAHRDR